MKKIILLTDYKNNFGSKWNNMPYRSGMDKMLLSKYFKEEGYDPLIVKLSNFNPLDYSKEDFIIYTSSEDINYIYKDYIEDIVLYAQESGLNVIPDYKYLRANNNKVFMELLKHTTFDKELNNLTTKVYGTYEEVVLKEIEYPIVLKEAAGAMSTGVFLAKNEKEFISIAKKISRTAFYKNDLKDALRPFRHKAYIKESLYRKKFITQQFIPNLKSDFKLLIFGERYYIFERPVRKNDFRASGSGNKNYIYGSDVILPEGILDFAKKVYTQATVPQLSIDIAYDGNMFYIIEFQALYFGTVGHAKSDGYYSFTDSNWLFNKEKLDIEKVYVDSIIEFIGR